MGLYDVGSHMAIFEGVIVGIIVCATWLSARQAYKEECRAERALEEREMLAALIENSSDFIGDGGRRGQSGVPSTGQDEIWSALPIGYSGRAHP
ncbi:MAG: hypothetical protein HC902_13975, partial [Calothrix sp. SM1_5_4]|nr:hypothetical protein [Calothrix sp. SM1_5_4]